jgi:hypothetical protein
MQPGRTKKAQKAQKTVNGCKNAAKTLRKRVDKQ